MQYFKGDATELKFDASGEPANTEISFSLEQFFDGAFECFALGDLLYDNSRAPLANAIDRIIYREAFTTIFDAFVTGGNFESYLTVFRNIFGDDVTVAFTVPAAGRLQIGIVAAGVLQFDLLARSVVGNSYVYDEIVTQAGENIDGLNPKGFQTQYEAEQMLFEMVPAGIFTEITLSIA